MYRIQAGAVTLVLNGQGEISSLLSSEGVDYAKGEGVPVAALIKLVMAYTKEGEEGPSRKDGIEIRPCALEVQGDYLLFKFENGIEVEVHVTEKEKYAKLAVTRMDKKGLDVELLMWGPITTGIKEHFGETLGVVYDDQFAIGMRGLSDKTQLTAPFEYTGHMIDGEARLNVSYPQDLTRIKGRRSTLDCCGASPTAWGAILQAFTYDGTRERIRLVNFVGEKRVTALSGDEAEIVGSTIAIYGKAFVGQTPKEAVLDTIETLELEEGLPHPLLDGEWQKKTPKATRPYFILGDLGLETIDQASSYAREAGIGYVYRDSLFTSNGTYQFAGGDEAMRILVARARSHGIKVGSHSLSGFIDYGDAYTTKANKGQFDGEPVATLMQPAVAGETAVYVTPMWKNLGKSKQIGDELVEVVAEESYEAGYKLTLKAPIQQDHPEGERIWALHNNQYGGLVAGIQQTREIAVRFAQACNHTGMSQISFDGVEVGEYTGYSHYSVNQIINQFYQQLQPEIQAGIISDSSGGYPNAWHVNTRQNWGEPWGAQMREGMIDYRYDNQLYFERNFTPKMLGWFIYEEGQPTIDIEWMLAKSAGFDAGYALVTSTRTLDRNGNTKEVLEAVKEWQHARECGAFTKAQMQRLLDTKKDWHLAKVSEENQWQLYEINYPSKPVTKFYDGRGETFDYFNPYEAQPLHIEVQARHGSIGGCVLSIDGQQMCFDEVIPEQGYLVYKGGDTVEICDARWQVLKKIQRDEGQALTIRQGAQQISFAFDADTTSVQAALRVITQSAPEAVFVGNTATEQVVSIQSEVQVIQGEASEVEAICVPDVMTYVGVAPQLPMQVGHKDDAGHIGVAQMIWEEIPEQQYQAVGRFEVLGSTGANQSVKTHVMVSDKPLVQLEGDGAALLGQTLTLTYRCIGMAQVSRQDVQIYFDKEVIAFNKEGEGIDFVTPQTRLQAFSVNNESALIDLRLEQIVGAEDVAPVVALTFTAKKEGIGTIAIKQVTSYGQDGEVSEAICTSKPIVIYEKYEG